MDRLEECAGTVCRAGLVTNMYTIVNTPITLLLPACFIACRLHCIFGMNPNNSNILLTAIGLLPGGSGYFTCIQNMKLVTTVFISGGLHEKHVVATWNLGNHLSICL